MCLVAAPAEAGPLEPLKYFADARVTAEVAQDGKGQLWLTVHTAESALAEATVGFQCTQLKPLRGTLRLRATGQGWQGACRLELPMTQLERFTPQFSVKPLAGPLDAGTQTP